jgi:hypothetical protein
MIFYRAMTSDAPNASLFRAGIGIDAALERDVASRIAEAIGRALRAPRDLAFVRQYRIAHARGRLAQASHDVAEQLRRAGSMPSRDSLAFSMMMAVNHARPESRLIADNPVADLSIGDRCLLGANDYFGGAR